MRTKISLLLLGLGLLTGMDTKAQEHPEDLYDSSATRSYLQYLMESQDYRSALTEWERLYFMQEHDDTLALKILQTYRLAGQYREGIARYHDLYQPPSRPVPVPQAQAYLSLLRRAELLDSASHYLQSYTFPQPYQQNQKTGLLLLRSQYQKAQALSDELEIRDPALRSLIDRSKTLPRKSPFLSGLLSGLIPGLGKAYTGQWKDGLFALVFVGANALGAYRGFDRRGTASAYGWIFGGIGTAFYLGNIYGSVKAAQQYNQLQQKAFHRDVEMYLRHLD